MTITIKDPETEDLARELAARTSESITLAIRRALEERLRHMPPAPQNHALLEELALIRKHWTSLPALDVRTANEIFDCDENGLPR